MAHSADFSEVEFDPEIKPVSDISLAIVRAATNCRAETKPFVRASSGQTVIVREILVFYEFLYFFMHMSLRQAFATPGTDIEALQAILGPLICSTAIDSYCGHWPAHLKQKMSGEFYDKLNQAEVEYSGATQCDAADVGEDVNLARLRALFMTLASNVASLAVDDGKDMTVIEPVMEIAIRQWGEMRLNGLMAAVAERGSDWLQRYQ